MDTSRRAVESYWRSRMIDAVTADEDKVAPVYKLEEVCELLRSSHPSIVKEIAEFIFKRLDHKSPIVKQKALRLIKYAVPKSGTEFRREMQRHSAAMRQLFHYKGNLDPLKGDALNKLVRETAHEAVSAVFATEESRPPAAAPVEGLGRRIEGFGNTNYVQAEEKKSFLSEMVDLGSASIKQGLSTIAAAHAIGKADSGSYKSPTLRRSLTTESSSRGYEGGGQRESWASSEVAKNAASSAWSPDLRTSIAGTAVSEENASSQTGVKSREERLLETIVTSGGVRLQPTRESLQAFAIEALKLDAVAMSRALELKLNSHLWQVRMKAICVLESFLRRKDEEYFLFVASYFSENRDSVVKCSELPHVSLREKASKVLSLLEGDEIPGTKRPAEEPSEKIPVPEVQIPDLIDTGDPDDYTSETSYNKQAEQRSDKLTSTGSLVDDLFGSDPIDGQNTKGDDDEHDPFADVSFHVSQDKEQDDIFSGLIVDDKRSDVDLLAPATKRSEVLDLFTGNSEQPIFGKGTDGRDLNDLVAGLTLSGNTQENKQPGASGGTFTGTTILDGSSQLRQLPTNGALNGRLGSNTVYPLAPMQYNMPSNIMLNQAFSTQPMNYGAMSAFIAQQQLLLQNFGNLNGGFGHPTGFANEGGQSPLIPDIFHLSNNQVQSQGPMMTSTKKDDTKAFDFIADHLSAARDSKRMI